MGCGKSSEKDIDLPEHIGKSEDHKEGDPLPLDDLDAYANIGIKESQSSDNGWLMDMHMEHMVKV